jgi:hypothetical protein
MKTIKSAHKRIPLPCRIPQMAGKCQRSFMADQLILSWRWFKLNFRKPVNLRAKLKFNLSRSLSLVKKLNLSNNNNKFRQTLFKLN